MISGGPGMSGINPYITEDSVTKVLLSSFDIIGYDPRGVGNSIPKISCQQAETADNSSISTEASLKAWVSSCIKHTSANVLKHIGSDEATDDLESIRQALGEEKLTAVAYSYGTQVAAMYAERYPKKTRAIVLDGVVDISEDDITTQINQGRGFQLSLERFAHYCAEKSSCPLDPILGDVSDLYHKLLNRIDSETIFDAEGKRVTSDEITRVVTEKLLWSTYWDELVVILKQVSTGNVDKTTTELLSGNLFSASSDAQIAITCADHARLIKNPEWLKRGRIQAITALAYGNAKLEASDNLAEQCDYWPFRGKIQAHIPKIDAELPQLLFVAQRFDPTTPHSNATKMSGYFRSPLLTKEGDGHTLALAGEEQCINREVVDYLLFPEKIRRDKHCY
ncbi:alpha/beta hydrolase [Limnobaculum xujianqingii]|uniref:alpha/beta hydrolase n=1 Tax=Limnobaculum xujianqingii TaxID=2738837 RepID=UPI001E5036C3|nr:alpha/beta hydrolase [Limnobaculum xujianqingii]